MTKDDVPSLLTRAHTVYSIGFNFAFYYYSLQISEFVYNGFSSRRC